MKNKKRFIVTDDEGGVFETYMGSDINSIRNAIIEDIKKTYSKDAIEDIPKMIISEEIASIDINMNIKIKER